MQRDRALERRASGTHDNHRTLPWRARPVASVLVLVLAACAGDDPSQADDLPEFSAPPTSSLPGAAPASSTPPAPADPGGAPALGAAGSAASPPASDEGGVTPTALDPGAGGSASTSGNAPGVAGAGGATGVAGATGAAGATASAGAAGATAELPGAGGAGMEPAGTGGTGGIEPAPPASSCPPNALFCDDFEDDALGQFPAAPWQNNTGSGASVVVDGVQAFSGSRAVHVNAPPNQAYRRGYFSLEQGSSNIFPAASHDMFGRAMMFLDATPNAVVHWTILQAEGRAADGTHDAYYRYGGQQQGGAGLMANYETNSGVSTDCYSHSATRMPVQRWACVEWHFNTDRNEMQLWLDGTELTDMHVVDRPTTAGSGCLGNGTGGEWLAPPEFTTLHLGWESYQLSTNDRNLWVDDVAIASARVGCPAP